VATALIFGLLAVVPLFLTQPYLQGVMIVALYYAMLAVAWNLLAGFGGQFSLAPAAFSLLGAYGSGVLNYHYGLSPLLGIPAGVLLAFVVGYGLGWVVLRMQGHYLALTTFAFLEIVGLVIANSYAITRGDLGLTVDGIEGVTRVGYFYLFLAALALLHFLTLAMIRSKIGLFIRAVRDDETVALSRGVDVVRWKTLLFALSSAMCGLAGGLYVHFIRLASPEIGTILQSGLVIAMVVIGGIGTLLGPVIGALLVHISSEALREVGVQHMLVFAALMIVVVRFFRGGLWALIDRLAAKSGVRRRREPSATEQGQQ
jgi:branched-chain amino acid transport system permease protein